MDYVFYCFFTSLFIHLSVYLLNIYLYEYKRTYDLIFHFLITSLCMCPPIRVFPTGRMGERGRKPPTRLRFVYPHTRKNCPYEIFILPLPLNNNFHVITQQKLHFLLQPLLLYHFHFNFILFVHTGHSNFDLNRRSLFIAFSSEKGSNGQNHNSSDSQHPMKKFTPCRIPNPPVL